PGALIFALCAAIGDHTEVVIGELQVVFGLHPIAVQRRIVRQLPVFFEKLRRIAARAAVDPITLVATALAASTATAAPAIVVAILVQGKSVSLSVDRNSGRMTPATAFQRALRGPHPHDRRASALNISRK